MADTIQYVKVVVIDPLDNAATAVEDIKSGEEISFGLPEENTSLLVTENIPSGHKVALKFIAGGSAVLKYGQSIGTALIDIQPGQHVHIHNLMSNRGRGDLQGEAGKRL